MKYEVVNINQAQGVTLCNDIMLGEKYYPKGHVLNAEDIIIFKMFGLRFIYGALYEDGDVEYTTALHQIAAQISGKGIGFIVTQDGVCKLTAVHDGIFILNEKRLDKFNSFNEQVILNTISPHQIVKSGDVIAKLEITAPLIKETDIDDIIFRLSGNEALLSVSEIKEQKCILLYPHLLNDENENSHFTSVVMKMVTEFEGVGFNFSHEINSSYDKEKLTDAIFDALSLKADIIFILPPVKSFGRDDVISLSIKSVTDDIFNYSIPQIEASDLFVAQKGNSKIISLPYFYDSQDVRYINSIIKHAIFTEHLNKTTFSHKRSALIEPDKLDKDKYSKLIMSSNKKGKIDKASVGIVILAAGQGRRSGANKLMVEDKDGLPMFMHAVNAAIASEARPVFIVTGYRNDEMEEWLEKIDINVLYNPAYASGIKTSISMGLKAIPSSCDGAILLPADMPYIGASELNKIIKKFDKTAEKQLCIFTNKGIKNNPILWSKSLFDKADIVPDNAKYRAVFVEHADYTNTVEIKDTKKLLDINYPNDIEEFVKK